MNVLRLYLTGSEIDHGIEEAGLLSRPQVGHRKVGLLQHALV